MELIAGLTLLYSMGGNQGNERSPYVALSTADLDS